MIDLTNKNIDEIINKHQELLQDLHKDYHSQMAYILEIAIPYIQRNHMPLLPEWKAWCILTLKKLQDNDKLSSDKDITNHIDGFVKFANDEYDNYVKDIAISTDEYYKNYSFMIKYLKTIGI